MGNKWDIQAQPKQTNKQQHHKHTEQHRTKKQVQRTHCHTIHSGSVQKHQEHNQAIRDKNVFQKWQNN